MISYVKGPLMAIEEDVIVVEAGHVGLAIHVPVSLLPELPGMGKEVTVYTYFQVREDAMTLYGFLHSQDRDMFRQLLGVNGIGPKGALGILSVLRPDDLRLAIVSEDVKALAKAPGIGNKTAQRLILDLKDKISMDHGRRGRHGCCGYRRIRGGPGGSGQGGGPGTGSPWLHQHRGIQGSEAGGGYGRNDFGGCAEGVPEAFVLPVGILANVKLGYAEV